MREDEIVAKVITDIESATSNDFDVRASGGDDATTPPEVLVSWQSERQTNRPGNSPAAGVLRDNNGNAVGIEYHAYYRMTLDITVRMYDQIQKDQVANDIAMEFIRYEDESDAFDTDTYEWDLSDVTPRTIGAIEPDWYESGVIIRLGYVKRNEYRPDNPEYLSDVQVDVEVDESLEDITTEVR